MFTDKKPQHCSDVTASRLHLQMQRNPHQGLSRLVEMDRLIARFRGEARDSEQAAQPRRRTRAQD